MKVKKIVELKTEYSFESNFYIASKNKKNKKNEVYKLDLNSLLVPIPEDYFLVKVSGESMINEGIYDGDILIVNRKEQAKNGSVVIAALNGELAVKTYRIIDGVTYLFSANEKFLPIEIKPYWEFQIQGIVKHVIHNI